MAERTTRRHVENALSLYSKELRKHGMLPLGHKLIIQWGNSSNNIPVRLFEMDVLSRATSVSIGNTVLGKTPAEAFKTLVDRTALLEDMRVRQTYPPV